MHKVIDIRENAIVEECMNWLDDAMNTSDIDMVQHFVDCGCDIQLELNVTRMDEHMYEEVDGSLYTVDPDYDSYGRVGEIEVFVIKNGEAVDSLTEAPWADTEDIRERIRELYRTWRK